METVPTVDRALSEHDDALCAPDPALVARTDRRARITIALMGGSALASLAVFAAAVIGLREDLLMWGDVAAGLVEIVALIAFLFWVAGAYRLAQDLSPYALQSSPGWAVAGFFIPVANLVLPYQRMREIEEASDPAVAGLHLGRQGGRGLIAGWWAAWLVSAFAGATVGWTDPYMPLSLGARATYAAVAIGSALLTLLLVSRLSADQQELSGMLDEREALGWSG